jgi:eukaryotic-like serine/threonine-protein kinase
MSFRNSNIKANSAQEPGASSHRRSASSTRRKVAVSRLLEDGEHFGKYEVVRWIARGGMSEVYEAVHTGLRKPVALKILRGELAENAEARDRFVAEGSNAALVRHPNVVDVSDVGVIDELPYLVMELLEGENLGEVLHRIGRMPVAEAVDLLLPVSAATAVANEHGVIHRDLKPDNIFLQYEGRRIVPKVLDFGASRVMHAGRLTMNMSVLGTPHYMSPEQARGETNADARSDQHALGVILYEAVTGVLPRDSADPLELLHQVAYGPFRPPSELMPLPDGLEAVILRAMAREPNQRFATTRDFALALLPYASEASRDYWSLELRNPSAGRTRDIAQPAVSSRRFTPGSGPPPSLDAGDGPTTLVNLPEAEITMLPSSRPPPPLLRPEGPAPDTEDPMVDARRSSRRKLLIGSMVAAAALAALLAFLIAGGKKEAPSEPSAAAAGETSPPKAAADPTPAPAETTAATASAAEATPEPSSASTGNPVARGSNRAARAPRREHAVPAKRAEAAAPEPTAARAVPTQEPSPKVRVIEDSKPKVQVIE